MSTALSVLLVEDDPTLRDTLATALSAPNRVIRLAPDLATAREVLEQERVDIAFVDFNLPDGTGDDLIRWATDGGRVGEAYGVTGSTNCKTVVKLTRAGCLDVIPKPIELSCMDRILENAEACGCDDDLDLESWRAAHAPEIIGEDQTLLDLLSIVSRIADSDATVLITGESGTGKELCARALHNGSRRASKPMVAINCAAIPESLIEAELFGHARGAFTGAVGNRPGRIVSANGGTLFLDEIGDMPLSAQAKLLRVLQEGEVQAIGSDRATKVDLRIVAATNKDLAKMVSEGTFRADLYFRLNVIPVHMPTLAERRSDVLVLAKHFLEIANKRHNRKVDGFAKDAVRALENHKWPGNIRELVHLVERAVLLRSTGTLTAADLPLSGIARGSTQIPIQRPESDIDGLDLRAALVRVERDMIGEALRRTNGNRTEAAGLLGLNRTTLVEKIRKHNC